MKIVFVNPGLIPIDLNSQDNNQWGATEKCLLHWAKHLIRMGHQVEIKYPNDIWPDQQDIVHVQFANQALMLAEKGVKYVMHLHDHHAVMFNSDSAVFRQNAEAIEKSIITLMPGEFLIDFFHNPYKCHFFSHGVDTSYFTPTPKFSSKIKKLLIIAHNGYSFNPAADRKNFRLCIEAAKQLNLPITVAGPSKNNKLFFEANSDLLDYENLTVKYDLNDEELLETFQSHSIFLNPSEIEAGQPNLTLLEAMACGLPVIATYNGSQDLPGIRRINPNANDLIQGIQDVLGQFKQYKKYALETAKGLDYAITTRRLVEIYKSILNVNKKVTSINFQESLINVCENTVKSTSPNIKPVPPDSFNIHFVNGAFVEVKGQSNNLYNVEFIDQDNDTLLYSSSLKPNHWTKTNFSYFINYEIRIKNESGKLIQRHIFDASNKNVYITLESKALGDTLAWFPYIEDFQKKHNCNIIVSTFWNEILEDQYPQFKFVKPGDNVSNLYAMYSLGYYSPIDRFRHKVDPRTIPLQKIAADILDIPFIEKSPRVRVANTESPIEGKYITISPNGTAQAKYWNRSNGWQTLIDHYNKIGYKIVLIQKENDTSLKNVIIPKNKNIQTAINYLVNSDFHISVSTGIAWLAWALNKKVVMISGITKEWNEFQRNCIHIRPPDIYCNGCFNDTRYIFDDKAKGNWNVCFAHERTERQFSCTKAITPELIINKIKEMNFV